MPSIRRDGAEIAWDVAGRGPAMLLGHGLLFGRSMWDAVVPRFAERYRVLNVAFRGHEASTAPTRFTLDDLADDWVGVLDAEGVDRAVLVGLSMGGMVAMRVALRAPDRVAALVLLDTAAGREPWKSRLRYAVLRWSYRRRGLTDALLGHIAPVMFAGKTRRERPELVEAFARQVRAHDRGQLDRPIAAVLVRGDAGPIERVACPTLVIVGEHDVATPPPLSDEIVRRIPGARLVRIPDAGHMSAVEQPERVADEVLRFLEASGSGGAGPGRRS